MAKRNWCSIEDTCIPVVKLRFIAETFKDPKPGVTLELDSDICSGIYFSLMDCIEELDEISNQMADEFFEETQARRESAAALEKKIHDIRMGV